MRKNASLALAVALMLSVLAGFAGAAEEAKPVEEAKPTEEAAAPAIEKETNAQKAAWCMGHGVGKQLKSMAGGLDVKLFLAALQQGLDGEKSRFTEQETMVIMQTYQVDMRAKEEAKRAKDAVANLKASEEFLAKNGKKKGVTTTASGLQYEIVEAGKGDAPKAESQATVHYTGALVDGTVFDSSVERGKPATFAVNRVIPGWTEALQLMKPGGKLKLYIPPALGYGEGGQPAAGIGPNVVLVFDVELISFK